MLAILTILFKYMLFLTIDLRCFNNTLFRLDIDNLLYLVMVLLNSSIEEDTYSDTSLDKILFKISVLTRQRTIICLHFQQFLYWKTSDFIFVPHMVVM